MRSNFDQIPQTDAPAHLLRAAMWKDRTEAEGPGKRFALWLQGCPLRCPGCCNPEMLSFRGGREWTVEETLARVRETHARESLEGITFLGGEPFSHAEAAAELAARLREDVSLSVMIFSGFLLEQIQADPNPHVAKLLANTDLLVDGPYLRDEPETERRWIGSKNQRVHFLSDRHTADDPRWKMPNTLEVQLSGGEVLINGFPAQQATGLWKKSR